MKGANFLEKLLDNQPVEWKKLGEVCGLITDFTAAGSFASNAKNVKYLNNPDYALLVRTTDLKQKFQNEDRFIYVDEKAYEYLWRVKLDAESIIMPNVGNCGEIYFVTPEQLPHSRCVLGPNALLIRSEIANQKFLYYLFHSVDFQARLSKITSSTGQTKFNKTNLKQLPIPIPPLSVQSRIVEMLDKFTSLEAELEAELELRKKQYAYYREQLLNFSYTPPSEFNVVYRKLGEVFITRNGYTPSKSNPEYWEGGTIPWYRMEDIRENGRILSDALQHITPKGVKGNRLFKADSIILATSATIGEHALITTKALANQRFTNFEIKEDFKEKLLPKFVFYYFYVIDDWCKNHIYIGNFPSVDVEQVKKMDFPLPPLSEQQRIVEILDKFDTLTNSISEGLPLEIQLRRQQYEYYREQLLDFRRF